MSKSDKRNVNAVHRLIMERFPKAFPKNYDEILPLKIDIHADLIKRLPEVDPVMIRRVLANHTQRDGYLLALIHHRGDRRYDLNGQPVGTVTPEERAEAQRLLNASTQGKQDKAEQVRIHKEREEKRRKQREIEHKNREAKARKKAENLRIREEAAARKAALAAQGLLPPPRPRGTPYHKKRSVKKGPPPRGPEHPSTSGPTSSVSSTPIPRSEPKTAPTPAPQNPPLPKVEFKKKRRIVLPPKEGKND